MATDRRLTLDEIDNFPIETLASLKGAQLRKVVADATRIANQRLRRLEKSGYADLTPAYESAVRHGHERFTTRGKKDAALRNEFREVREFLKMKTSTASGFKKVKAETYKRIGGGFKNPKQEKDFWRAYRKLEQSGLPNQYGGSTELIRQLYQARTEEGREDLIEELNYARGFDEYDEDELAELTANNQIINDRGEIVDIGEDYDDLIYLVSQKAIQQYEDEEAGYYDDSNYRSI